MVRGPIFFNERSFSLDEKISVNCDYKEEMVSDISSGNPDNLEPVKVVKNNGTDFRLLFSVLGILTSGVFVSILLIVSYFRFRR